jgi:hypothetical protein
LGQVHPASWESAGQLEVHELWNTPQEAVKNAVAEDVQLTGDVIDQVKLRVKKSGAFTSEVFKDL